MPLKTGRRRYLEPLGTKSNLRMNTKTTVKRIRLLCLRVSQDSLPYSRSGWWFYFLFARRFCFCYQKSFWFSFGTRSVQCGGALHRMWCASLDNVAFESMFCLSWLVFFLKVAERLELPSFVIERARSLLDENTRQVQSRINYVNG